MLGFRRSKNRGSLVQLCSFQQCKTLLFCISIFAVSTVVLPHLSVRHSYPFVLTKNRFLVVAHQKPNHHHQLSLPSQATPKPTNENDDNSYIDNIIQEEEEEAGQIPKAIVVRQDMVPNFDERVNAFLDPETCTVYFFMTWISEASRFGAKEMIGLETLFSSHPRGCLVILSHALDSTAGRNLFKPLTDLDYRILPISPDYRRLLNGTVALNWYSKVKRGRVKTGKIPFPQHLSDLLRLVVLYKYGGVYLDTDFVVLNDFSRLRNAVGAQSIDFRTRKWTRLNGAVMIFDKGHPLVAKFLDEFVDNFEGNRWGHNGPYLVSRVIGRLENGTTEGEVEEADDHDDGRFGNGTGGALQNYTVLPPIAFYPVDWIKISGLFESPKDRAHEKWVKTQTARLNGSTYGVHLWNKISSKLRIEKGSVMWKLISYHCIICEHTG